MLKSSLEATFLPAQTSLLSSIQRAKQRIFSKSQRDQEKANTSQNTINKPSNDENNSLNSNLLPKPVIIQKAAYNIKLPIRFTEKQTLQQQTVKSQNNSQQVKRQKSVSLQQPISNTQNQSQSTAVVANAIKLLQDKIHQLQNKNKFLEQKLNESRIIEFSHLKPQNEVQHVPSSISQESDIKSYLLLKHQCQTLQKQNASLYQQLLKRSQNKSILQHKKQSGRKLNFHHEISQNISGVYEATQQNDKDKIRQLEQKLKKTQEELRHYRASIETQRKKNFAILKLHQEEIIKSEQLQVQVNELKHKLKELQEISPSRIGKSATSRRQSAQNIQSSTNQQIRQSVIRKKNLELQKIISQLREEIQNQKNSNQQKVKQVSELERRYIEVKETFIELYKDLLKYHPEVINANIKFLYDRVRKGEEIMMRSRSILSHKFGKHSQSRTNNRLSEFRSKSGKKGLKMEDLNSSKRSQSRERTNSKTSNRSNSKSNYRSPYAQEQIKKKGSLKSALSPPDKQRHRSTTGLNHQNTAKLKQIQKIIAQIKQVKRQINGIKTEHRNLSVKMGPMQIDGKQTGAKMSIQDQKNQERMNRLIEEYNEKNAKLYELKLEKDRLAMETVPGAML